MKKKYLLPIIYLSIITIPHVNAESCDTTDIERLTTIANHVDLSYNIEEMNIDGILEKRYRIVIGNMTEEFYILKKDKYNEFRYDYQINENKIFNEITLWSGEHQIEIYSKACNQKLRTIELKLPYYNEFHNSEFCNNIEEKIEICEEWIEKSIDKETFEKEVSKYKENQQENKKDKLSEIFNNYFIYVIAIVIVIIVAIITMVVKKKRSELK